MVKSLTKLFMGDEIISVKVSKFRNLLQDFVEYLHHENMFERFSKDRKEADMSNKRKGLSIKKGVRTAKDIERVVYLKSVFLNWFNTIYLSKFYGATTEKAKAPLKEDIARNVLVKYEGGDFLLKAPRIERSRMD